MMGTCRLYHLFHERVRRVQPPEVPIEPTQIRELAGDFFARACVGVE